MPKNKNIRLTYQIHKNLLKTLAVSLSLFLFVTLSFLAAKKNAYILNQTATDHPIYDLENDKTCNFFDDKEKIHITYFQDKIYYSEIISYEDFNKYKSRAYVILDFKDVNDYLKYEKRIEKENAQSPFHLYEYYIIFEIAKYQGFLTEKQLDLFRDLINRKTTEYITLLYYHYLNGTLLESISYLSEKDIELILRDFNIIQHKNEDIKNAIIETIKNPANSPTKSLKLI